MDSLDGLHVPHAMVLLRELEMQAHKVADPNRFVMDAVNMAGQDKIALPEIEDTLTPIGKRVAELNQSGQLSATLKIGDVKEELAQLSEEEVLEALDEVANRGHSVKDPTGYWKFKLKVRLALQTAAVKVEPVETEKGRKAHFVPRSRAPVAESVVSSKVEHDENEVEEPLEEAQEEEPEAEEEFEVELERREDEDETVQELDFNHEDEDVRSAHQDNEDEAWNWEEDGEDVEQSEWAYETVTVAKQKHNQALREHNPKVAFAAGAAGVEGSRHTTQHKKLTRVVGGVKGCNKLVPKRPDYPDIVKKESEQLFPTGEDKADLESNKDFTVFSQATRYATEQGKAKSVLPLSPQEKLLQVRTLALKHGLHLDEFCLKSLARLPFHKAKDMIDDVLLGGRNRTGVSNPSRYLTQGIQRMTVGLGVEQGLAMEMAVSLGLVLNNDALDELASIPRKEWQAILRGMAKDPEAKKLPMTFVRREVLKCRARLDARPFPGP